MSKEKLDGIEKFFQEYSLISIGIANDFANLGMAQFHLVDFKSFEEFGEIDRRTRSGIRNDSLASLEFLFERQTGTESILG